jgi:hypothetical protein
LESQVSEPKTKKQNLLRFAGSIDQADLALMQQAIADECEKMNKSYKNEFGLITPKI